MAAIHLNDKEAKEVLKNKNVNTTKLIRIVGNAIVLTSNLKLDTIKKMEKYNNNALCLVEVDKDEEREIFRIATGATCSISKYGITFAEANKDGYATATVLFPNGITDKKTFVKDEMGQTIFMLKQLEKIVENACENLELAYAELDNDIEEE
jgi:hypothetical protein